MGLREKARKSLETDEEVLEAPVQLKVDAAERVDEKGREETSGRRREGSVPAEARRGGRNPRRVPRRATAGTRRPREVPRRAPGEARCDESRRERGPAGDRIVPHEARGA